MSSRFNLEGEIRNMFGRSIHSTGGSECRRLLCAVLMHLDFNMSRKTLLPCFEQFHHIVHLECPTSTTQQHEVCLNTNRINTQPPTPLSAGTTCAKYAAAQGGLEQDDHNNTQPLTPQGVVGRPTAPFHRSLTCLCVCEGLGG